MNLICQTDLTREDFEAMAEELQTVKAKQKKEYKFKKNDVKW